MERASATLPAKSCLMSLPLTAEQPSRQDKGSNWTPTQGQRFPELPEGAKNEVAIAAPPTTEQVWK